MLAAPRSKAVNESPEQPQSNVPLHLSNRQSQLLNKRPQPASDAQHLFGSSVMQDDDLPAIVKPKSNDFGLTSHDHLFKKFAFFKNK